MKDSLRELLIIGVFLLSFGILAYAQDYDLDFEPALPVDTQKINSQELRLVGRDMQAATYASQKDRYALTDYYNTVMQKEGFKKLSDQFDERDSSRTLKYQKDELMVVIRIFLAPKEKDKAQETRIGMLKYLQPKDRPPLEKSRISFKDTNMQLPKQDIPGEDPQFIPRPPQSIRLVGRGTAGVSTYSYTTPLSVQGAVDFYKMHMSGTYWQIQGETPTKYAAGLYKDNILKKDFKYMLPIDDGEDLDAVINDSYSLYFQGKYGSANIIIYPNLVDRKLGSIVFINFTKA
ncbi:hypothetical protein D4R78_03055 [bacterium]|nr:MAG: hypothetical protein D4R78_03055 [bacterium]